MQPKQIKTKFVTVRVTDDELTQINQIRFNYLKEGIKVNRSKIVRDVLLNLDKV